MEQRNVPEERRLGISVIVFHSTTLAITNAATSSHSMTSKTLHQTCATTACGDADVSTVCSSARKRCWRFDTPQRAQSISSLPRRCLLCETAAEWRA